VASKKRQRKKKVFGVSSPRKLGKKRTISPLLLPSLLVQKKKLGKEGKYIDVSTRLPLKRRDRGGGGKKKGRENHCVPPCPSRGEGGGSFFI